MTARPHALHVSKARTPNQHAAANGHAWKGRRTYGQRQTYGCAPSRYPPESWWAGLSREEFRVRAQAAASRMNFNSTSYAKPGRL